MAQLSQTLTIPAEVSQLAATYRVGTPLKRYRPFSMARMIFAILCLAFAVPCIIAVGSAGISSEVTVVFGGIALLLVVLGLLLLFVRTKRATSLYLYTDGVISLRKRQAEAIRWDQVVSVIRQYSAYSNWDYYKLSHSVTGLLADLVLDQIPSSEGNRTYVPRWLDLFRADGTHLRLDLMLPLKYREFARSIEGEITQRLLPQLIAAYDAGNPVEFPIQFGQLDSITVVSQIVPDGRAFTLREHASLVQLPDDRYTPRELDPRVGYFGITFKDYAQPIQRP